MNGMVNVVLYFPRYMMITGITVLALAFCLPDLKAMPKPDFESLLPIVLTRHVPAGIVGLLLAGLLAAFMSNFAATINAAPAYIVNDVYKRFINSHTTPQTDVWMSRVVSLVVLLVGIAFGMGAKNIFDVMGWIVGALYGGYVVANVLKWYWWRFNGYGYFCGMMAGIIGSLFVPDLIDRVCGFPVHALYSFPILFLLSAVGCVAGTYASEPENDDILMHFYRTTRPWGAWGPIRQKVVAEDPAFQPNDDFGKDVLNVAVGIVWQLCLTSLPIFLVLRSWTWFGGTLAVLIVASVFIKFNWYDKLPQETAVSPAVR